MEVLPVAQDKYSLTPEFVYQIITDIEKPQNLERKRIAFDSDQIKNGKLKDYVSDRIREMYPKTFAMYTVSDYSVLKKVVEKKAQAYTEAPIRKLGGKNNKNANDIYQKIVNDFNLNSAMAELDECYHQHLHGLLAVFMDREPLATLAKPQLSWKFYSMKPYEYDIVKDEDGRVKVVILSYPATTVTSAVGSDGYNAIIAEAGKSDEASSERVYALWTDNEYREVRVSGHKGQKIALDFLPTAADGKNPYGTLPFVYAPQNYDVNYPNVSPLPYQTVELNALLSVYLTSANMQVGILKITRPEKQKLTVASQSMYTAIEVPQSSRPEDKPSDISFIAPSPNMSGHKEAIVTYLTTILDEQGINGNAVANPTQDFASGLDRLIAQADVQKIIEKTQELFHKVEKKVYDIVRAQLASQGQNVLPDEQLQIVYKKPKVLISDREKLENLKLMKELGLWAEHELIQMYDPNLTEDEAKEKLAAIKASKVEQAPSLAAPVIEEEDEEEEAEEV